ncbi:MAG TPA: serine/threonine-protein kinase, partial [Myxococcota bacterium]
MSVDDDPLVGRELGGRYRVLRQLGKGGMGTVYLAKHEQLQRDVVVKVISRDRPEPEVIARFKREALALGQLSHPNVVSVYDFGVDEQGMMYLVMELLEGRTLRDLLDERRLLPAGEAIQLVADIARGLAHAHERGVVHRDLKPGNVMVVHAKGAAPFAKILDFGVAKLAATALPGVTATETGGSMLGTPGYIAPEHVNGVHDDPRSDLYSLGCILFEMLTGTEVFTGETPMKVVLRHVADRAPRVQERNAGVPPALDALVTRLLSKDPAGRPASAEVLLEELASLPTSLTSPLELSPPPSVLLAPPAEAPPSRVEPPTRATPFDTIAA